jgi:hypothetical protein
VGCVSTLFVSIYLFLHQYHCFNCYRFVKGLDFCKISICGFSELPWLFLVLCISILQLLTHTHTSVGLKRHLTKEEIQMSSQTCKLKQEKDVITSLLGWPKSRTLTTPDADEKVQQ